MFTHTTTQEATMFTAAPATTSEYQANQDAAKSLGATCPNCGELAHVDAAHRQATRSKPCEFLGVTLYCECAADFMSGRGQVGFIASDELSAVAA